VTTQPLDVVYNPLVLDHISEFFSHTSMEGTQALHIEQQLREVARVRYEEIKNQTKAELVQTLNAMTAGSEVVCPVDYCTLKTSCQLFYCAFQKHANSEVEVSIESHVFH